MIKHDKKTVEVKPAPKGMFLIKVVQGFENTDKKNIILPKVLYEKTHRAKDFNEAFAKGNEIKEKVEKEEQIALAKDLAKKTKDKIKQEKEVGV